MKEVNSKQEYLVYTCETEKFDDVLYFPSFDDSCRFVRWALWFLVVVGAFAIALQVNKVELWIAYCGSILCFVVVYIYYGQSRAAWLREGIVYEVTNTTVRSMTHSGEWLGQCNYKNKSIKIMKLKNGYSEVHIRSKRIEYGACLNLFLPPDIGQSPCVFVMYQMSNADFFTSLMLDKELSAISE